MTVETDEPAAALGGTARPGSRLSRRFHGPEMGPPPSVRDVIVRFVLVGLVALVAVGVGTTLLSGRAGKREAIAEGRRFSVALAKAVIEPALDDGLVERDERALSEMDMVVRAMLRRGPLVRVKIWAPDGTVVYSDEPRLIGSNFPLSSDEQSVLDTGRPFISLLDGDEPQNRFEREEGPLLEIYQLVTSPAGVPLLFESYVRYDDSAERNVWFSFVPLFLGGLLLLELVQIPLALSMARRLRRVHRDRERLLRHAVEASDQERRRIAADLHDGVVQDLAGVSLELAASARADAASSPAAEVMEQASAELRRSVKALRSLLVDIYPPNLEEEGLESALADLLVRPAEEGMTTRLEVRIEGRPLLPATTALVYRAAREALRNVVVHSGAAHVAVTVVADEKSTVLTVDDDGRGVVPGDAGAARALGHVGLRTLADVVADAAGILSVEPLDGGGTRLRMEVPRR